MTGKSKKVARQCVSLLALVVLTATVFLASGCNNKEWVPDDTDHILKTVSEIGDARNNPTKLKTLFAEDAVPDKAWLKKSRKYMFLVTDAKIDGDTAVATVELEENSTGEIAGTQQWACERIDGEWKIKTSPIE